jgi:glycogen debranching enzyme
MLNTLHEGTSFLITTDEGEIDHEILRGSGLYYEDSRFLSQYRLLIDEQPLILLSRHQPRANEAIYFLTNPRLINAASKGMKTCEQTLSVTRRQFLKGHFQEEIKVQNFGDQVAEFVLSIRFSTDFENIFTVKAAVAESGGRSLVKRQVTHTILPDHTGMLCTFDGLGVNRRTILKFSPKPDHVHLDLASFTVKMPRMTVWTLNAIAELSADNYSVESLQKKSLFNHKKGLRTIQDEYRGTKIFGNSSLIPKFPYYGTIDATILFLITLSEYTRYTGDLPFVKQMWPHVERALEWMHNFGDRDGDGLIEYVLEGTIGLSNQGWKDSWDSVRFQDGRLAKPPIALVEVQGYAFAAYQRISELAHYLGKVELANDLHIAAEKMRKMILTKYWMKDRTFFAEALDSDKVPVSSLTSNPGHLLWSGVLDQVHAEIVANRLVSEEMFSGYGIRTMGKNEGGYNPLSYHNGSVWPHDNSLIVLGMIQYGLHEQAKKIVEGLLSVLSQSSDYRFPELFAGFDQIHYGIPVDYPSACRPQAWASGAVLLLVRAILGLEINVISREITLNPIPILGMTHLRLKGISILGSEVEIIMDIKNDKVKAKISGLPRELSLVG